MTENLSDLRDYLILPEIKPDVESSWFGYLISVKENSPFKKQELVQYLENNGIGTRQLFSGNILRQPLIVNNDIDFRIEDSKIINSKDLNEKIYKLLPNSEFIMNNTFWVGTFPALGENEISRITKTIKDFVFEKIK